MRLGPVPLPMPRGREETMVKRSKRPSPRHIFHTHLQRYPGGPVEHQRFRCRVKNGKVKIRLPLVLEHIETALKAHGKGSTAMFAMAICCQKVEHLFPHPVLGIDWQYRTLYVIDAVNKDGLPISCVRYSHHSDIAKKYNDDPKGRAAGLRRLKKVLEGKGGTMEV